MSKTGGSEFIDIGAAAASERHLCTELAPLSVYAMSGLARYDLRHAVVAHGEGERISVTFRSVNWDRVRRAATRAATTCERDDHDRARIRTA